MRYKQNLSVLGNRRKRALLAKVEMSQKWSHSDTESLKTLKIALTASLAPKLEFSAIFAFFGHFSTPAAQKYQMAAKTEFLKFWAQKLLKVTFSHPLGISDLDMC